MCVGMLIPVSELTYEATERTTSARQPKLLMQLWERKNVGKKREQLEVAIVDGNLFVSESK